MCRIRLPLTAAAFVAALLVSPPADACSCAGSGAPCQAFFDVSAVFVGTVRSIGEHTASAGFSRRRVHLDVSEAFRGVSSQGVDVDTGYGGGDCGYPFKVGETYVVYASLQSDGQPISCSHEPLPLPRRAAV